MGESRPATSSVESGEGDSSGAFSGKATCPVPSSVQSPRAKSKVMIADIRSSTLDLRLWTLDSIARVPTHRPTSFHPRILRTFLGETTSPVPALAQGPAGPKSKVEIANI